MYVLTVLCILSGQICFRGPSCFIGYYKNEEKTAETIDKDGWVHSGDVGKWLPNGALKIIDRKKQIFKTQQVLLYVTFQCQTNSIKFPLIK